MKKLIVDKNQKRVTEYLLIKFNKLKKNAIYKALRNKDIRVNGIKISENIMLNQGDELTIYITDDILYGNVNLSDKQILYNDENIIIVNKPQNVLVTSDGDDIGLDKMVSTYLNIPVYPCHRLDRNTSGLVIFAKDHEAEEIIAEMIKSHCVRKLYKCTVYGKPKNKTTILTSYLFKDRKNSLVIVSDERKKGYVEITTKYSVLKYNTDNTTDLEVELITGRTHQIRAHLAHIGFPIIGDGKYGINEINKKFNTTWQKLSAYKIIFNDAYGKLEYLKGKEFELF